MQDAQVKKITECVIKIDFSHFSIVGTQKNYKSQWDGSFEHTLKMVKMMDKNIYNFTLKNLFILGPIQPKVVQWVGTSVFFGFFLCWYLALRLYKKTSCSTQTEQENSTGHKN